MSAGSKKSLKEAFTELHTAMDEFRGGVEDAIIEARNMIWSFPRKYQRWWNHKLVKRSRKKLRGLKRHND